MLEAVKHMFGKVTGPKGWDSREGYDMWAAEYDNQPENLMLRLDEDMLDYLLQDCSLYHQRTLDIGCGTGRHWQTLISRQPATLTGIDVSPAMLAKLSAKYPEAAYFLQRSESRLPFESGTFDRIVSTLTMAHIRRLGPALMEWDRVLSATGEILITDFHPILLALGGRRSFTVNGTQQYIRNHIHQVDQIAAFFESHGYTINALRQSYIDEAVRPWYAARNAMHVYNKYEGIPVIYGLHVKRQHVDQ